MKMFKEKKRYAGECQVCKKTFYEKDLGDGVWYNYDDEVYEYRGFESCADCFDELVERVDNKRNRIIEEQNSRSLTSKGIEMVPPRNLAGNEHPLYKADKEVTKVHRDIASNPNWEEENEYRKGKL